MAICGMTNEERQILINQYAIMTFLLGVHTKDMNGINECAFKGLQQSIESTGIILRLQAQVPRWIPVTERLPERADEVLIAYREEYDDWTEEYSVSTATYMPRAGRWDYDHLKITHWMPLPKAPDLT